MAWTADVVHHYRAADLAGVVNDDVAEAHHSLWDAGRDSHILNLAEWDVFGRAGDEAGVALKGGIGDGVTNHGSPQVVVSRNQQQCQSERN